MSSEKAIELKEIRSRLFDIANSYGGDVTGHIAVMLHEACNHILDALAELEQPKCDTCGGSGRKVIKPIISQNDFPRSAKFTSQIPQTEPCPDCQKPEPTELDADIAGLLVAALSGMARGEDIIIKPVDAKRLAEHIDRQAARIKKLEQPEPTERKLCRKPHWKGCVSRETYEGHTKELNDIIDRQATRIKELEQPKCNTCGDTTRIPKPMPKIPHPCNYVNIKRAEETIPCPTCQQPEARKLVEREFNYEGKGDGT